jgi:hypothetical protein
VHLVGFYLLLLSLMHGTMNLKNLQDFSERVISPTQRPLPDNTQHTKETYISIPPVGFELTIPESERPQTYAIDRVATGTGRTKFGEGFVTAGLKRGASFSTQLK